MKGETFARQGNPPGTQRLVMGNQEDLDLLMVAHDTSAASVHHLVLVEVKAYGYFTNKQWESKVARLKPLFEFYKGLEAGSAHKVCFHYVLYSPNKPTKLSKVPLPWGSPDLKEPAPIQHIQLKLPLPASSTLAVSRCDGADELAANGDFWRCIKLFPTNLLAPEDAIGGVRDSESPESPVNGSYSLTA